MKIQDTLAAYGITINEQQAKQFLIYYQFLAEENKKYNLTRICAEQDVLHSHFVDSLQGVAMKGEYPSVELLDLGSGAGFPGIPLKIYYPPLRLYLLEASGKKIAFLQMLAEKLNLQDVHYLPVRAEEWGRGEGREAFSWVTARAVAPLVVLAELALPLLNVGGYFWAFKGPDLTNEMKEAKDIIAACGGILHDVISYLLPGEGKQRSVLIFKKIRVTDARFPRRPGIPQKRPFRSKK